MSRTIDADALIDILKSRAKMADGIMVGRTFLHVARIIKAMPSLTLNDLRDEVYQDAVAHGLWEEKDGPYRCARKIAKEASELIEAAEDLSVIYHDTHDYADTSSHYADELSDVIIMSLSVAGKLGIDIDEAVKRKMEINKGRPWKHGKEDACNT